MSITVDSVIQSQAHIGTLKAEAHPKTSKYRSEIINGVVVIDPQILANQLEIAQKKVQEAKAAGKEILIVSEICPTIEGKNRTCNN